MPILCQVDPALARIIAAQDYVVSRTQALGAGMTRHSIAHRKTYDGWQKLLPEVYLCHPGEPSRRQRLIAALLYAGPEAAIDDVDACHFYGIRAVAIDDERVFVVVPATSPARSHGFVVVRRTEAPIRVTLTERLRYAHPADAVMAAARRRTSDRAVLALLSDAVQRQVVTHQELMAAHVRAPRRNALRVDDALDQVGAGVRSLPEGDFCLLAEASSILPPLLYNRRLRLPEGQIVVPDALALDAALVQEINGQRAHRRADLFEDMQVRHTLMTVAGLTALHATPRQLALRGRQVVAEFERCYLRDKGRGLPPGVVLLPEGE